MCPFTSLEGRQWAWGEYTRLRYKQKYGLVARILRRMKIGTRIERATRALGIEPCERCKKTKAIMNGELTLPTPSGKEHLTERT